MSKKPSFVLLELIDILKRGSIFVGMGLYIWFEFRWFNPLPSDGSCPDASHLQTISVLGPLAKIAIVTVFGIIASVWLKHRQMKEGNGYVGFSYFPLIVLVLVVGLFGFANAFSLVGLDADGKSIERFDYLYFTTISMTTVGYGDIVPCPAARPLASVAGLFGLLMFPMLAVAAITDVKRMDDEEKRNRRRKLLTPE